jgi:putative acetyltransferase
MEVKPYKNHLSTKNKTLRVLWGFVYAVLFRPTPNVLFWEWRVFLLRLFGARIGKHCKIRSSATFWAPWNLRMGDYVSVGQKAQIYSVDTITLHTKVCISQGAYLCTASHDITNKNNPLVTSSITVNSFAWVAADAFVGMGVTIGEGAVVGARAAVFKDVEAWTVVGGNPAKFIKQRIIKE